LGTKIYLQFHKEKKMQKLIRKVNGKFPLFDVEMAFYPQNYLLLSWFSTSTLFPKHLLVFKHNLSKYSSKLARLLLIFNKSQYL